MSKQIDERVVSMQFDNRNFEQNVSTTMSTLDKLKQKLHLDGASKGLENVGTAAKNCDMSPLSRGVETVQAKFSALQVMGVTALSNITNSAVNAAKNMVNSLTIAPVKDGFSEYEMTLNAVQTTMAATGKTAKEVEKELKTLDEYADKTVYSTADMLNNLPKFTNAGVKLEDATKAMIGIANATALAGGDAGKASIAFYNLGQAIGTGYLTRMDYNSINNAGIATMEWKNQMVEAAIAQGTLTKVGEDAYQAGNKTLTLQQLFIDGLQEQWATTDVMMKVFGDYGDETTEIGKKSYSAAQDIKTFSMMMDSLKATAGTGWKDTWQIIFGDLDKAKDLWTGLTNFISGIITKMADWRNYLLDNALNFKSPLDGIKEKLSGVNKVTKTISKAAEKLEYYQNIVDKVWNGDYKNSDTGRYGLLADDGYDYKLVQHLVNETEFVDGHRVSVELLDSSLKKYGYTVEETTEETKQATVSLSDLSDEQLKNAGLTEDEIRLYRELAAEAERTGKSIEELAKEMSEKDGRTLLIESFKNAGQGLIAVFNSLKKAWSEIFPPMSAVRLYNIIKAINTFSQKLKVGDDTAEKLTRTFKGVFAILKIVYTLVSGPIKIAFKILSQLLSAFNIPVLDLTANVGDAIVAFSDWLDEVLDFTAIFERIVPVVNRAIDGVKNWFNTLKTSDNLPRDITQGLIRGIGKGIEFVVEMAGELFMGLVDKICNLFGIEIPDKPFMEIAGNIISGLRNGLSGGIKTIFDVILEIGKTIIDTIKNILGIHSPSTEFFEIGKNIIQGLFNGISDGVGLIWDLITSIGTKIIELIQSLDIASILTAGLAGGMLYGFIKIATALHNFSEPFEQFGDLVDEVRKTFGALKTAIKAEAIKSIAIAIAILAGSIAVLSLLDPGRLWGAVGAIAVLMGMLAGLTYVIGKFGPQEGIEFGKLALALLGLSASLLIIAWALKSIASIDENKIGQVVGVFIMMIGGMVAVLAASGKIVKNSTNVGKLGSTILKISVALLLMAWLCKIIGNIEQDVLIQGGLAMIAFGGMIVGLMAATKLISGSKNVDKIGKTILSISAAILLMALTCKMLGKMDTATLIQGTIAIAAFGGMVVGLMAATKLVTGSKNVGKVGSAILGVSAAILLMALTCKLLGGMDSNAFIQGTIAMTAFGGIVVGLMAATKLVGGSKNVGKIGKTILAISVAIAILAGVAVLLGMVDTAGLAQGVIAVGILSALMAMLIASTKDATKCVGNIVAMAVAIAVMATAIGILSMIDIGSLASSTAAISAVMGMFTLMVKQSNGVKSSIGTIAILIGALAGIAGALYLLSSLPATNVLASALALSTVMAVLTGVLFAISKMGKISIKDVGQGALGLAALVGVMALVGLVLAMMSALGVTDAITNATALSGLMVVLTGVLLATAAVGIIYTATAGIAATGLLGLVGVIGSLYLVAGVLAIMNNIENAQANSALLINLLNVMTDMMVKLAIVGPLALIGVTALAALTALILGIGVMATAIGGLMELCPTLETFVDKGIGVMIKLAGGLGEMVSAFLTGAVSGLPEIGSQLSLFMTNVTPFINGVKLVDGSVLAGVGILVAAILALTAANLIEGIASFFSFGSSFASLGTELSQFIINAMPFITNSKLIDPSIMTGIKTLAEAVLILTGSNILEGLTSWFTGGSSLAQFGSELGGLGTNLNQFVTNLGTFDEATVTTVDCAGRAIKALAESAGAIPNEGGLWASIVGENSLATFGSYLPQLGKDLNAFVTNLGTFDEATVTTIDCAGRAIKALAESAGEIPNEGGLWAAIAGDNSLATWGSKLPQLGTDLNGFITNLGTFDDSKFATVDCAGKAIKALADSASQIPNEGGLWASIAGDNSLATFGNKLPQLGTDIAGFVTNLGTFGEGQIATVNSACTAIKALASLGEVDLDDLEDGMEDVGEGLSDFADDLSDFVSAMGEVKSNGIESAITKFNKVIEFAKTAAATNVESLKTFGETLVTVAEDSISDFVDAFTGDSPAAKVKKAASDLITNFTTAIKDKKSTVKSAFETIAEAGVDKLTSRSIKGDFEGAGEDLAKGFANGIKNKKYLATDAGSALGKAALEAAKEALDEHSPSREMYKVGDFAGRGFVNALYDNVSTAYKAGGEMADSARFGLSRAIAKITDVINNDIDAQPTIRPILDLSDVRTGANAIGGLFGNRTLSVNTQTVGAIAASMANLQNGNNSSEIVSGIKALRKDIANMPRNSYNLNGISIEEGSDVADAIQVLVRAARIEGRI